METFVKAGVPLKVQDWEEERQRKLKPKRATTATTTAQKSGSAATKAKNQPQARIEAFAKVTKPGTRLAQALSQSQAKVSDTPLPPAPFRPTAQPQGEVIDLSSPSPVKTRVEAPPQPQPQREKSLSPVPVELPPSVTKRRRRAPIQRSRTLPADTSTIFERSSTPPLPCSMETLDLVESPARPSPSPLPTKPAKIRQTKDAPSTRAPHSTGVGIPSGKSMQSTLDAWRVSVTPTKSRHASTPAFHAHPVPPPPRLRSVSEDIDSLDLTLSSPAISGGLAQNHQIKSAAAAAAASTSTVVRPPLTSISSNTSNASTRSTRSSRSTSSINKKRPSAKEFFGPPRHTSPRLSKTTFTSTTPTERGILDLTSPHVTPVEKTNKASSSSSSSPIVETLDLTELLSSPQPERTRVAESLHQHQPTVISPPSALAHPHFPPSSLCSHHSSDPQPQPRPEHPPSPAQWKARAKKKRAIILRESLPGAWTLVDLDSPEKKKMPGEGGTTAVAAAGLLLKEKEKEKGKARRKWRESGVQELDLT
ncbi:flap structure-specific endonuclease [Pyrenophora seminiperda CCB06]|uniref:Flap structure-specific endonuclease n=1 Tax=Pyrenophora seminiperda CCB06 TaxID=1302712 RepID=A0A3M7MH55_9PLEO|nr:flap structure-specific endonuclease [Pyrenophora seminiperda CCB06]